MHQTMKSKTTPWRSGMCVVALSVLSLAAGGGSATVLDASAPGCPAWGNPGGNSGVEFTGLVSIEDAVELSTAQITDAWYEAMGLVKEEVIAARIARATEADKNGDGLLCVAQNWGQDLNPNSHWAQIWADLLSPPATEAFFISDNNTGRK